MWIKNYKLSAINENRKLALDIVEAGLAAADAGEAVKRVIASLDFGRGRGANLSSRRSEATAAILKRLLRGVYPVANLFCYGTRNDKKSARNDRGRVFVVGVGKGSLKMAAALEEVLGDKIHAGIVLDIQKKRLKKIKSYAGDHPLPSERNIRATKKIIDLLTTTTKDDLVIACIAGGGSSLLCQPNKFVCQQEIDIVRVLTSKGVAIKELNIVRKHLSLARGGHLAHYAYPAQVIALIVSDVPGDDLRYIASGPTVKDATTITDAKKILKKYNVPAEDFLMETPKEDRYFEKVHNVLILSNKDVLKAMAAKACQLGLKPRICDNCLQGEAREVGLDIIKQLSTTKSHFVMLYGGETTVTLNKNTGKGGLGRRSLGVGGRNLELALSALRQVKKDQVLISFASDGIDNTDFAGGICDLITKEKAKKLGLNLDRELTSNNSYNFFKKTGCYIMTGYTGSNVSDLIVALRR